MLKNIAGWFTLPRYIWLICSLLFVALFSALPILDLRLEEPRRALVAMEMMFSGNYIMPTLNGEAYYNKPPLFNWMIILFYNIFGSFDEWVVRIPSVLGFIGIGLVNFFVVKKYINRSIALVSTFMIYTTGDFLFHSTIHSGEIDLFYSLIVVSQAIALFIFYDRRQYLAMFMVSYFLMAGGVLTKGLPSFAFQAITLLAMAIYYKDLKLLIRWQHITGLVFSLALLCGYFYWYNQYEEVMPYLVKLFLESSEKSVVENAGFFAIAKSVITFPLIAASKILPWSLFILVFLFGKKRLKDIPKNPYITFAILFTITNIALYWITPDVKFRYVFMFYPFLITIIAYFSYDHLLTLSEKKWFINTNLALHFIVIATLITGPFLQVTRELTLFHVTAPLLLALALFNLYYYKLYPKRFLFTGVLLLVILRLTMNVTYLPLSHKFDNNYKDFIDKTIAVTEGEKVYFTGGKRHYSASLPLGLFDPQQNGQITFSTPAFIYYKLPYYFGKEKNEIMPYHETPVKGNFYVTEMHYYKELDLDAHIYTISSEEKRKYVLFKLKDE